MLVSSANNFTVLVGSTLPISLTYIKKSNGPRTEPCGTLQTDDRQTDRRQTTDGIATAKTRTLQGIYNRCSYIDQDLKWTIHIDQLCVKLQKLTGIFYKLRTTLPLTCLKTIYFAFVHPHLLFGVEMYANTGITFV